MKNKIEFSKVLSAIIVAVGIGTVVAYYWAIFAGHEPDGAVAIAGITEILGAALSYTVYQGKLKTSLNNNQLYINDSGEIRKIGAKQ